MAIITIRKTAKRTGHAPPVLSDVDESFKIKAGKPDTSGRYPVHFSQLTLAGAYVPPHVAITYQSGVLYLSPLFVEEH